MTISGLSGLQTQSQIRKKLEHKYQLDTTISHAPMSQCSPLTHQQYRCVFSTPYNMGILDVEFTQDRCYGRQGITTNADLPSLLSLLFTEKSTFKEALR